MRRALNLRSLFFSLGFFLIAAPMAVILAEGNLSGLLPLAASVLLGLPAMEAPKRLRLPAILLAAVLSAGAAVLLPEGGLALMIFCAVMALLHPWLLSRRNRLVANGVLWITGIGIHVLLHIVPRLLGAPAMPALRTVTYAYFLYLPFAFAMQSLADGVGEDKRPSLLMRGRSAAAAALWTLFFLILTHLETLKNWLRALVRGIERALLWIGELLSRLYGPGAAGGGGGGRMDMGLGDEMAEPSLFAQIMEKVALVFSVLLGAVLVVFLIRFLWRLLRQSVRNLIAKIRAYADTVSEPYEDTVETLIDWGEVRKGLRKRASRPARKPVVPWDSLPPREKVRWSYRRFLSRHPNLPSSQTARQALPDPELARIYERARYSREEISEEEARRMRAVE